MEDVIIKKSEIHGKGVYANRDFKKGEEITGDYSKENIPNLNMKCNCGNRSCKKIIK